jgi:hypothetical protein
LWLVVRNTKLYSKYKLDISLIPYLFFIIVILSPFIYLIKDIVSGEQVSYNKMFNFKLSRLLFIITFLYLLSNLGRFREVISLWFLLIISWCASISWGYAVPVLFSTPLIFGFLMFSKSFFNVNHVNRFAKIILFFGSIVYFLAYQKPYCNPSRNELNYELDDVFPKLSNIKVSKEIYDKYIEFNYLHKKYGNNFKTLPGMPLSNYLTNTQSPLSIDWVINAETTNQNDFLINILKQKGTYVFMERHPQIIQINNTNEKFNSSVSYYIKCNWKLIEKTKYFDVFIDNK